MAFPEEGSRSVVPVISSALAAGRMKRGGLGKDQVLVTTAHPIVGWYSEQGEGYVPKRGVRMHAVLNHESESSSSRSSFTYVFSYESLVSSYWPFPYQLKICLLDSMY
ncbi:hypothetical protein IEQ34_023503 [Dendrobium chrysotoxum]|uniref:Uncharacterized protein n=1 Tax=Dendrobium chrysotoxum TaxID=161865 RepID=A0AAV7FTG1_DENCH|nr:hypothetical protein IEQ34_025974 [Dendrobium chrysotoxum]KAH0439571.1 hypothetical protein IEQ34_025854 [Dendrobium chrysotoxum]KAH0440289.1 hypothetical protein IEQ34_025658 [Dendrobium chrysotoxum]KAH0445978.1 hypothetical protein IEQ34_025187 [Dendrobium chrysotoxum]KAH0446039.1 hypothetical protein IEQ34_025125 [Dendrobium chrysotoxum]